MFRNSLEDLRSTLAHGNGNDLNVGAGVGEGFSDLPHAAIFLNPRISIE